MTRAKISEYSATANDNTDVNGIDIAEGCPPSSMNNMGREIMAALKRFQVGSDGDGVTVGGSLVVSGSTSVNTFNVDVISEKTSATGVTIDGVLLKDSGVVTGAGTVSAPVYSTTGDLNTGIFFPAADTIAFAEGGAEAMRIDSSGNVGIGTSSPGTRLQVREGAAPTGFSSTAVRVSRNNYGADFVGYIDQGVGHGAIISTVDNGTPTERMRIDSSGNFLVNTTDTTLYNNTSGNGVCYRVNASLDVAASGDNCIILNRMTSHGSIAEFRYAGSIVGSISVTGSATAYNTSSDYRLKHDIAPMTGALAKVAALKPVTYKWNADDSAGEGFIAHELQAVAPYAVSGEKDGEQMQGVDYGKLTPILTAALQEAIAKIETLEARIAVLEAK